MPADEAVPRSGVDAVALVQAAQRAAFAAGPDGTIHCWNPLAEALLGFAAAHARGRHLDSLLGPRDVHGNPFRNSQVPALDLALEGDALHPFEMSVRDAGGERVPLLVAIVVVLSAGGSEGHRVVYLLERRYRRRRSDEVIERLLSQPDWPPAGSGPAQQSLLSPRQHEVLRLLAQGEGPQEIADALSLSVYTVRSHLRAVFEKLEVHSQSEAVAKAFKLRLL